MLLPLLIAFIVLGIDQATKHWIRTNLAYGQSWAIIPALDGWLNITYIHNSGAAFGILPQANLLFIIIAVIVVVVIVVYYLYLPPGGFLVRASLGLQLGGALGNLLDRLRYGYVTDFVDIGLSPSLRWSTFNVADACIVIGVCILAYHLLFVWPDRAADERITKTTHERAGQ